MMTIITFTKTLLWAGVLYVFWSIMPFGVLLGEMLPTMAVYGDDQAVAAPANSEAKKFDERKTRKTPALREKIYNILVAAQKCADKEDFICALKILEDGLGSRRDRLNSYEKAQYYKLLGSVFYRQQDYDGALGAYNAVLAQENLPSAIEDSVFYGMAELFFMKEDFQNSIIMMRRWMAYQKAPQAQALVFLGQIYYALGLQDGMTQDGMTQDGMAQDGMTKTQSSDYFKQGIPYILRAMDLYKARGKETKESWYLLLGAMYFERQENQKLVGILEILVSRWPKKDYWLQLSSLYGQMAAEAKSTADKRHFEQKQLATYETAYVQGLLNTESELLQMAQLYIYHGEPYWGSIVLDRGLKAGIIGKSPKNYERLAQSRLNAQDIRQSLGPLKKAAERSDNGTLYQNLGQVYMRLDEYDDAVEAFNLALKKGGAVRVDRIEVYLGISYFHLGALGAAQKFLELAAEDSRSHGLANQWISYLGQEKMRLERVHEFLP